MQVFPLDDVGVDDGDPADAGAREVLEDRDAEAAGADDEGVCGGEAGLAVGADLGKDDLAGVAAHARRLQPGAGAGLGVGVQGDVGDDGEDVGAGGEDARRRARR